MYIILSKLQTTSISQRPLQRRRNSDRNSSICFAVTSVVVRLFIGSSNRHEFVSSTTIRMHKYYVVEFEQKPHPTMTKIAYIPASWIRWQSNQKVTVSYPLEQDVTIHGRIISEEPFDMEWRVFIGIIKTGFDDIDEARSYAAALNRTNLHGTSINDANQCYQQGAPMKRTNERSKSVGFKASDDGKRRRFSTLDGNIHVKHSQLGDLKQKESIGASQYKSINQEIKALKELANIFNSMKDSFETMSNTLKITSSIMEDVGKNLAESEKNMKILINESENKMKIHLIEKHGKAKNTNSSAQKYEQQTKMSHIEPTDIEFPDNSDKRLKWTLRHKTMTEGLVELVGNSGVYVRKVELEKLATAKDAISAARMLMTEIFSDHALKVCSLHGGRWKDPTGILPPGLDEYAQKVMLMYLNNHCRGRNWNIDNVAIENSLRRKLLENRKNYLFKNVTN